tara:strand:+ start:250 stop:432 length:183 start_codon:yes stop_codon:yes gene_type:complete
MLEDLFSDLKSFIYSLGIISIAIALLMILPKKMSMWLGKFPMVLIIMFVVIMTLVIQVFN